jgi:hypothetical protein
MTTRKIAVFVLLAPILFSAFVHAADQDNRGVVAGVVVNESGSPVAGAQVMTRDLDSTAAEVFAGAVPYAETDAQGRFVYRGLKLGHRYKLYAEKDRDGYPYMMVGIYNPHDDGPIAVASAGEGDITVPLGPKAGRLTWSVYDAVSGRSIDGPTIFLERTDTGANIGGSGVASEGILAPSGTDLTVKISASGYRDWYHPGTFDKSTAAPLRLMPGEERTLQVRLQPLAK